MKITILNFIVVFISVYLICISVFLILAAFMGYKS